jgi:hypothetical protein
LGREEHAYLATLKWLQEVHHPRMQIEMNYQQVVQSLRSKEYNMIKYDSLINLCLFLQIKELVIL